MIGVGIVVGALKVVTEGDNVVFGVGIELGDEVVLGVGIILEGFVVGIRDGTFVLIVGMDVLEALGYCVGQADGRNFEFEF